MGLDSNRSCQSGEQRRWKESGVVPIPAVTSSLQKQDQKRRFSGNGGHLWLCRISLSPPVINTAPSPLCERTILLWGWKQESHKETLEINRVVFRADWLNSFIPRTFTKHLLCPNRLRWWLSSKAPACHDRRLGFHPRVTKIPWGRKWQPTPVFLPGKIPWTEESGAWQPMGSQSRTRLCH